MSAPAGIERIFLAQREKLDAPARAPVRIFIGTEPAQHRAERVLIWSIESHRDPARGYEIVLLRDLPGFDRRGWTTGFTNYRYAVPEIAGATGRAIYNDVDQLYLADPGLLFDTPLDGHGFLAISPDDPSVMLIDCEAMAACWSVESARRSGKEALQSIGRRFWGALSPTWNARDAEYRENESRLIHFTTLHTQPWRPFPDRFVYHAHPQSELWHSAEKHADAAAYEVFSRTRPSPSYQRRVELARGAARRPSGVRTLATLLGVGAGLRRHGSLTEALVVHEAQLRHTLSSCGAKSLRIHCFGSGAAWRAYLASPPGNDPQLARRWGVARIEVTDVAERADPLPRTDVALCVGVLEDLPVEDLPWALDAIFAGADTLVHLGVTVEEPRGPWRRHEQPPRLRRTPEWWMSQIERVSRRHPDVRWQALLHRPAGGVTLRTGGRLPAGTAPRVWVLTDDRPGNTSQSRGLAEALGWPYREKQLRFGQAARLHNRILRASLLGIVQSRSAPLKAPWPDLVVAAGRRSAPVAQWIRERSFGRTRLVHLGRKGGDAADQFDLVVAPHYGRLDPHPRRVVTHAPLHAITDERVEIEVERWRGRLGDAARPRIVLLAGGWSGQYALWPSTARELGRTVSRLAADAGGSVLASTSRRLGAAAAEALAESLRDAAYFHRWSPDDPNNPYLAFLGMADAFVVTCDSEAMLAEAASRGKPVYIYPLPVRSSFRWMRMGRDWVYARAHARPETRRRTVRPQRGLAYLCARLIDRGYVRPTRDLVELHERLIEYGVARPLAVHFERWQAPALTDLAPIVERVREMMGWEESVSGLDRSRAAEWETSA